MTSIVEKRDIERVVNNERDVSKDRDIELGLRWSSENEDVLFNVFDVLDLIENALVNHSRFLVNQTNKTRLKSSR